MQEPEENKRVGKHAAPNANPSGKDDVIRADTDLYGDETDIPLKVRKKEIVSRNKNVDFQETESLEKGAPVFQSECPSGRLSSKDSGIVGNRSN